MQTRYGQGASGTKTPPRPPPVWSEGPVPGPRRLEAVRPRVQELGREVELVAPGHDSAPDVRRSPQPLVPERTREIAREIRDAGRAIGERQGEPAADA